MILKTLKKTKAFNNHWGNFKCVSQALNMFFQGLFKGLSKVVYKVFGIGYLGGRELAKDDDACENRITTKTALLKGEAAVNT